MALTSLEWFIIVIVCLSFVLSISSLVLSLDHSGQKAIYKHYVTTNNTNSSNDTSLQPPPPFSSQEILENFKNSSYPYPYPASKTAQEGEYETYNRECPPKTTKCRVTTPLGQEHYFCSTDSSCNLVSENVQGAPLEEPIPWSERFA